MMKNIFKNKKVLALIIALILIVIGVVVAVVLGGDSSKENDKSGIKIENEKGDDETEDSHEINESGLSIEGGTVDTIDGSGDWDAKDESPKSDTDKSKNEDKSTKEDDKQDVNQEEDVTDNKEDNNDTSKEDPDEEESSNMSNQDILVDDKTWGDID